MRTLKYILLITLLQLTCMVVLAQSGAVTSGSSASGSNGSISFTVGQLVQNSFSSSTGKLNQGLQQPFEFLVKTGIPYSLKVLNEIQLYPNPSSDRVNLICNVQSETEMSYLLIDMNGKVLLSEPIITAETVLWLNQFASASYNLTILKNQQVIKTFQLIKN